jgi:hypothetical protein
MLSERCLLNMNSAVQCSVYFVALKRIYNGSIEVFPIGRGLLCSSIAMYFKSSFVLLFSMIVRTKAAVHASLNPSKT